MQVISVLWWGDSNRSTVQQFPSFDFWVVNSSCTIWPVAMCLVRCSTNQYQCSIRFLLPIFPVRMDANMCDSTTSPDWVMSTDDPGKLDSTINGTCWPAQEDHTIVYLFPFSNLNLSNPSFQEFVIVVVLWYTVYNTAVCIFCLKPKFVSSFLWSMCVDFLFFIFSKCPSDAVL